MSEQGLLGVPGGCSALKRADKLGAKQWAPGGDTEGVVNGHLLVLGYPSLRGEAMAVDQPGQEPASFGDWGC